MRWFLSLLLLSACGGGGATDETTVPRPERDPHADLHELNERARAGAVTETLHGVEVEDPYRALETESDLTREWIETQTNRTREALPADEEATARMRELLGIGSISRVAGAGSRVFFQRREGDREQPLYMVRTPGEAPTEATEATEQQAPPADAPTDPATAEAPTAAGPAGAEAVLIDPTAHGERAALDWAYPSPSGRYVAFGISQNGDERSVLHVLDVDAKLSAAEDTAAEALLPDRIARTKWSSVAWLHDETGFYYSRYPNEGEPGYDAEHPDNYFPRIYFHALGSDPATDPLVFGSETGTDFPVPSVSTDDRHLVINVFRGWSASDVFLHDRRHGPAPDEAHPARAIVTGRDNVTHAFAHDGRLYLHTNIDAPRYRFASVPVANAHQLGRWQDVLPQRDAPLEHVALSGRTRIVGHYLDDVRSRVLLFDRRGREIGEVELPARGALEGGLSADVSRTTVQFSFSGYLLPPTLLEVDASSGESRSLATVEADFDFSPYVTHLHRVRSADGTEVPVTLIHREDQAYDRRGRVIVYGYGGFNISLLPSLRRNVLYWLERGGVYAVANLRGGGEFGEEWHRAGNLENKEHVFEDFEAILDWLASSELSARHRIGITGGSNGGLLMGAMMTRAPEKFVAAASYVGLYDMIRYHRFPPAELWVSEYGSSEDPAQFRTLFAYSPYHRVRSHTPYPAILVETADHDSRVHWAHSTKFVARLQEASTSERPIYFYMERAQGHGAGTRLSDQATKFARMYQFFDGNLARTH